MDLIKSTDTKYEEYENLLLERDQLQKEAESIWICYIQTFGKLISDIYEEKLECIKCKKIISYYQAALNHGGHVDPKALQEYMDKEMASYYSNLQRMLQDNERCRDAKQSTAYEVQQSKTLYRRLAKLLHPDINPEAGRREELKELWQRVLTAYGHNDVKALSELEILTQKALKELGSGEIKVDIPDIEERIESLKEEIYNITHSEPYTYRDLLADKEATDKKIAELTEELESYRKYHQELEDIIAQMIEGGGIIFQWIMK